MKSQLTWHIYEAQHKHVINPHDIHKHHWGKKSFSVNPPPGRVLVFRESSASKAVTLRHDERCVLLRITSSTAPAPGEDVSLRWRQQRLRVELTHRLESQSVAPQAQSGTCGQTQAFCVCVWERKEERHQTAEDCWRSRPPPPDTIKVFMSLHFVAFCP